MRPGRHRLGSGARERLRSRRRPAQVVGVVPNDPAVDRNGRRRHGAGEPPRRRGRYGLIYTIAERLWRHRLELPHRRRRRRRAARAYPRPSDTVLTPHRHPRRGHRSTSTCFATCSWPTARRRPDDVAARRGLRRRRAGARDGSIRVKVGNHSRIIPFEVPPPRGPRGRRVRVRLGARIRRRAAAAQTASARRQVRERVGGRPRPRRLRDRASGRPVRSPTPPRVRASHSDGENLVVDDDTLRFTAADRLLRARIAVVHRSPTASPPTIPPGASRHDRASRST